MKKFFPFFCVFLTLCLLAENIFFRYIMLDETPWFYPCIATLTDLAFPVVLLLMMLFHNKRVWLVLFSISFSFVLLLKTANVILYSQIMEILAVSNCSLLLTHTSFDTLRILYGSLWFLKAAGVILGVCLLPALLIFSGKYYFRDYDKTELKAQYTKAGLLFFLLFCLGGNWYYTNNSELIGKSYFRREYLVRPALIQVQDFINDLAQTAKEKKAVSTLRCGFEPAGVSEKSKKILKQWGMLPFKRSVPNGKTYDIRRIIVVAAESLNQDYLRTYNAAMPENITPFLDKMCREYVSFSNYFTASQPTSWALDSIFLSRVDYQADLNCRNRPVSICSLLRKKGWNTLYFTPTTELCFSQGKDYPVLFQIENAWFQEQIFKRFGYKGVHYWGLSDHQLFTAVFQMLQEEKDKFLCVISTIDLHDPYTVSGPAAEMASTGDAFLDSLRATDRNIQGFVEKIMASPMFDDHTLIVLTADHSATFGKNYTKRKNFDPARIPLILITRNNWLKREFPVIDRYGSQVDLPPTLLGLLGIKAPDSFMGNDLRSGKNFAFAKTVGALLLYLPGGRTLIYEQNRKPANADEKALKDYFEVYYSHGADNGKK